MQMQQLMRKARPRHRCLMDQFRLREHFRLAVVVTQVQFVVTADFPRPLTLSPLPRVCLPGQVPWHLARSLLGHQALQRHEGRVERSRGLIVQIIKAAGHARLQKSLVDAGRRHASAPVGEGRKMRNVKAHGRNRQMQSSESSKDAQKRTAQIAQAASRRFWRLSFRFAWYMFSSTACRPRRTHSILTCRCMSSIASSN